MSIFKRISNKLNIYNQRLSKAFRKYKPLVKKERFVRDLSRVGIKKGDTLLIHSSLSKLGNVHNGPQTIIDALIEGVGDKGNIVMPSYSYINSMLGTTTEENYIFDSLTTPSVVGIITNIFRKAKNIHRSIHPTHSFCAFGPEAEFIVEGHLLANTNFGIDTPFHNIRKLGGKIVGLGIGIGPITIYHMIEDFFPDEFKDVYLPEKFPLKVRVKDQIVVKNIQVHNPNFHSIRIDKDEKIEKWFTKHFKQKGILHEGSFGSGNIWWMNIQELFDELVFLKKKGISIYSIPKE